jgi:glycosyltransferase involved in cell wall biosynthesis
VSVQASVVLPAFNEAENIKSTIERTYEVLNFLYNDFEILVVDNCSEDDTHRVVNDLKKSFPMLKIVNQKVNVGYSLNVSTGIAASRGEYIYVFDGDGQFDPGAIKSMDSKMKSGADLVLGYRTQIAGPFLRRILSRVFLLCARLIINFDLRDINSGARGLSRKLALENPITCGTSMVNAEIFLVAKKLGLLVDEVEVGHEKRAAGFSTHQFIKPFLLFNATVGYLIELRKKYVK